MSAFNSFTYVNSDTLSKLAELQHNISDTQGRPTFSVFGFVPVYDHRLDSTGDAPFTYKFGEKDPINGNITKFPASNMVDQPFTTLVSKLDGILFEDDLYFWRPPGSASAATERTYGEDDKYRIVRTSKDYTGVPNASHFILAQGYWECVAVSDNQFDGYIGSVKFEKNLQTSSSLPGQEQLKPDRGYFNEATDQWEDLVLGGETGTSISDMPQETKWIYRTTNVDTQATAGSILKNVPVRDDFGVVVFNNKIITPRGNYWVWQLSTQVSTHLQDAATQVDYDVLEPPTYGVTVNDTKNVTVGTFSANSKLDNTIRAWERFDNGANNENVFNSSQFIISQSTVDSLGNQIDYSNRIVDLDQLQAQGFSMFENIRFFTKAYKPEGDVEQTIATYRLQLNDQCGTIRFNKIVSYIRFYQRIPQDDGTIKWGWSKELYPFTVSILPEPIIKADYGKPGLDSFELDIQINYGQMISRIANNGNNTTISFDTNIVNNFDGWAVLNASAVSTPNDQSPAEPADISGNNFFGVQWDKRVFASTDIDTTLYDRPGTYVGDKYKKEFARINSENKSYVYTDVDLSDPGVNDKYMFSFIAPLNGTFDVTDNSVKQDPNDPSRYIATVDYVIRYIVGTETPGIYSDKRLMLYTYDGDTSVPTDTPHLSEAIVNRDEKIRRMRADLKDDSIPSNEKPKTTTIEWVEIEQQYATNNILDFSNNGNFYDFQEADQRNFDYQSYFKWMTDNTGAQDPNTEFLAISNEKYDPNNPDDWHPTWMKPTLDLEYKILGYDKILDLEGDPVRIIASSDYDDYGYWDYGIIQNPDNRQLGYKDASRDYSPSLVPGLVLDDTPANRNVLHYDKVGFGQFRSPWQHIVAKRIYGTEQVWGKKVNGGQEALYRMDGKTSYNYANEQYLFNKVIVANDMYSGIGYKELTFNDIENYDPNSTEPVNNTYPVFKYQNYNSDYQKDIIDDILTPSEALYRYAFAGTMFKYTKLGEYHLLWSKKDEDLDTSNDSFLNGVDSRSIFNITKEVISPYNNFPSNPSDITLHSGAQFRNLVVGESSISGRSYGNLGNTNDIFINMSAIRLSTGTSTYTNNSIKALSNISSYASKNEYEDSNWDPSVKSQNAWYGQTLIGYNIESRLNGIWSDQPGYNERGLYKFINKGIFGTIGDDDYSKELGLASGIKTSLSGFESFSIVEEPNSTDNYNGKVISHLTTYVVAKDFLDAWDNEVGTILSSDQTSYSMLFRTTGQQIDENKFIGRQGQTTDQTNRNVRDTETLADGVLISSKFLTGILKMPRVWSYKNTNHDQNSSTFRLGSYSNWTMFTEADLISDPNHWDVYSSLIANYGDQYQNGQLIFNIEYDTGYVDNTTPYIRNLISAYKHNISETLTAGEGKGDFNYTSNELYDSYKRMNMAILKSPDYDSGYDTDNFAIDLNLHRNNDSDKLSRWYMVDSSANLDLTNRPLTLGFTKYGSLFIDLFNGDKSTELSDNSSNNITEDYELFDRALLVNYGTSLFGGNIISKQLFVEDGNTFNINSLKDGVVVERDFDFFYNIRSTDDVPKSSTSSSPAIYLNKQVNSTNSLGYVQLATQLDKIYTNDNYINRLVYNPAQAYSDFITGNDWNTEDDIERQFGMPPRANMYYAYYGFTASYDDNATWRDKYLYEYWDILQEVNGDVKKAVEVFETRYPFFDVKYNDNGYNKVPVGLNKWQDVERMRAVATHMNTDVVGNLIPSVENSTDDINIISSPAINWKYSEEQNVVPFGYTNREAALYMFNVYGKSVFSLGHEWQSYYSASVNKITTAVLSYPDYENTRKNYYPYMDGKTFAVTIEGFRISDFTYTKSNNYQTGSFEPTLLPMRNMDWMTGDVIPEQNTVLRYFNSNHEVYMGTPPAYRPYPGENFWYGYIFPSAPALGSSKERFSDGYFNRISVRFAGQHDETIEFEGKTFHRQEQPTSIFERPSDMSNRYPQYIFGQDTADSGYVEFINQPHREDDQTFSRFVMEPTGGDAWATGASGASSRKIIAHSMMWNHSLKLPESTSGANPYDYAQRMDEINPFQILPQMAFEETTDFDTSMTELQTRPIIRVGNNNYEYKWVPTIDLGGYYSGHRNPTNEAMYNSTDRTNGTYHPTYLYEFRNIYSMDMTASNRVSTVFLKGTWNHNQLGVETDIIPVYGTLDLGNVYNKWRDSYMSTINLIYDSADYADSLLVQEAERQLNFMNITRDTWNGQENDINNSFFMKFGGLRRYHYAAEDVGYNKDHYRRTHEFSGHPWDYTEYNSFQVQWGWDYQNPEHHQWTDKDPFTDMKIRFQVLPQMANVEQITYAYPTMDLGGYDETLEEHKYFHTIHQWHVKTGTIGVLGSYEATGVDERALTFLNSIAFNGGIQLNYTSNYNWEGVDNSEFSHPLFDDASAFADQLGLLDPVSMLQAAAEAAIAMGEATDASDLDNSPTYKYYDQYANAIKKRNEIYGVQYGEDLSDPDWDKLEIDGRTKTKGIYGIHMLQGELARSTRNFAGGGETAKNYLPIYVAGDLLPTLSTHVVGGHVVGISNYYQYETDTYSSLGSPGHKWKALWVNDIYLDGTLHNPTGDSPELIGEPCISMVGRSDSSIYSTSVKVCDESVLMSMTDGTNSKGYIGISIDHNDRTRLESDDLNFIRFYTVSGSSINFDYVDHWGHSVPKIDIESENIEISADYSITNNVRSTNGSLYNVLKSGDDNTFVKLEVDYDNSSYFYHDYINLDDSDDFRLFEFGETNSVDNSFNSKVTHKPTSFEIMLTNENDTNPDNVIKQYIQELFNNDSYNVSVNKQEIDVINSVSFFYDKTFKISTGDYYVSIDDMLNGVNTDYNIELRTTKTDTYDYGYSAALLMSKSSISLTATEYGTGQCGILVDGEKIYLLVGNNKFESVYNSSTYKLEFEKV